LPRISAAHEQEVRDRILAAAARVFAEKGYHSSTIADVVRESGLSVGAIYTHFSGKDELIRLTCDQLAARGLDELAARLARADTTAERLAIALRLYVETIDEYDGAPGQVTLVQAWAEADREPGVREMLAARRERLVGAGRLILAQGVATGELPSTLDVDAVTRGVRMLALGDLTRPQLGIIHRQLTEAYVALEAPGLAAASCAAWRDNDKKARLDTTVLSPKIVVACSKSKP